MTFYTSKYLEDWFKKIASGRIKQKKLGESKYANDAGYWDGGRCEWGGTHNLVEDCEKLAEFFAGITELKNARKELLNFTNQQEFDRNKQSLLTKTTEAINGLQMKTSNNSSIGGICIIWNDFSDRLGSIIENFRKDLELLKKNIENVAYNEAKELLKLLSEERKIKNEIEENERKARNEPDKDKSKQFIFLADQAKGKWKKLLERKQQLKTAHLGNDFNPDQHIDNFFQKLEEKLSGRNKPNRPFRTNFNQLNNSDNPTVNNDDNDGSFAPFNSPPLKSNEKKPSLQKRWKELLLGGFFLLGLYYIYTQPNHHE